MRTPARDLAVSHSGARPIGYRRSVTVQWVLAAVLAGLAMVAAIPLTLRRVGEDANAAAWQRYWPVVGVVGALSLVLPRGGLGVGCAFFYAAASAAFACSVPARLLRPRPWPVTEIAATAALLSPLACGVVLVLERTSSVPRPGLLVWVSVLHAVGFALTMLLARRAALLALRGAPIRLAALGCALLGWGPLLAAGLFFVSPLAGALVATVGIVLGTVLALRVPRPPEVEPCSAQIAAAGSQVGSGSPDNPERPRP